MKTKTVVVILVTLLIAIGSITIWQAGSVLTLDCARTASTLIQCSIQPTLLGLIPLGEKRPIDMQDVQRVCYKEGCNYFIITGEASAVGGISGEAIDAFIGSTAVKSVTEHFTADWLATTLKIGCIAIPAYIVAGVVALSAFRRHAMRNGRGSTNGPDAPTPSEVSRNRSNL